MVNYLPVGSEEATRFYVACALEAGLALVNNIPVFIASDPVWAKRFEEKNLPLVGDDIKAQLGATVLHRTLVDLFRKRGVKIERTYQLNTGGNTDFLNMSSTLPPPGFAESIALSHKLLLPEGFQVRSWNEIESSRPVGNL